MKIPKTRIKAGKSGKLYIKPSKYRKTKADMRFQKTIDTGKKPLTFRQKVSGAVSRVKDTFATDANRKAFFAKVKAGIIAAPGKATRGAYTYPGKIARGTEERTRKTRKKFWKSLHSGATQTTAGIVIGGGLAGAVKGTEAAALGVGLVRGGASPQEARDIIRARASRDFKLRSRRKVRSQFQAIEQERLGLGDKRFRDLSQKQRNKIRSRAKKRERQFFRGLGKEGYFLGKSTLKKHRKKKSKAGRPRTVIRKRGRKRRVGRPRKIATTAREAVNS